MLEPLYTPFVADTLTKIEGDPGHTALWNAICDVIDLICDHPGSAAARREQVRTGAGILWQVPVYCRVEDDDWIVLWRQRDLLAEILYVGSRRFPR